MALGSYDNNRDQQKHTNVYSAYGSINTRSTVDPTRIRYGFWNKTLKIEVIPIASRADDGKVNWDFKNSMTAYLTHTKAYILACEIRKFLEDPIKYNSSGIISNETLVTISNGSEFGTEGYFLVLRKVNKETGATVSSYSYQFNTANTYNSVRNYDEKEGKLETEFEEYSTLEIQQLLAILDNYVNAMTYATAYSVVDASDYNYYQMMDTLEAIAANLGVSTGSGGSRSSSGRSVFNQRNTGSSNNQSSGFGANSMNTPQHVDLASVEGDLFD